MDSQSVTELTEAEIVGWLFTRAPVTRDVRYLLEIPPDARLGFGVCDPVLPGRGAQPGDVDVLACVANSPQFATAIECKRVKVSMDAFATGLPTKLSGIDQGAYQARALLAQGFHRVVLLVIVQVDAREQAGLPVWARGLTPSLSRTIRERLHEAPLPAQAGCALVDITQWGDKHVFDAAAAPMSLLRAAAPRDQTFGCTDRIRRWLARGAA